MVSSEGWLWIFRAGMGFLLLAALLFLLGFATDHWHDYDNVHYGLWNSCDGARCSQLESDDLPAYHIATQAFQTMAVIFFGLSPIIHLCVYCCKKRKDTGWRSRILDMGYSSGILFHVCSLLIFGLENPTPENFSWSYRMSCASSAIAFLGIVMIIVSRSKALYKFTFRSISRSKRKTGAATGANESTSSERRLDQTFYRSEPFHHQEEKVIINSSTSEQSRSIPVPDTNVNINITINASGQQPDNNNTSQSIQASASASSHAHQPQPTLMGSPSRLPPIVPETHQRLHPRPSLTLDDQHTLTQVRSAPKSSIAPYTSPTHKKTFGPADRRRNLELGDNNNLPHPPGVHNNPLPSISGRIPSAPPYGVEEDFERDIPPPSYSDAVRVS